jgi:folate-binding protein YgfZ
VAATDTDRLRADYETLIAGCGLLDRSERGKLVLTGAGAVEFLNGQITNELAGLPPGAGCYAAFLTNKGKMLGDLRVLAVGEGAAVAELLLDTERVALQALFDMIRRYKIGYDVALHKRTLESALLSLIGPAAREVATRAARLADGELPARSEHDHAGASVGGRPVRLIATADGGLDVLCAREDREAVAAALIDAGARAIGEEAAEVVRVEHGRPRYGVDLDESTIPQEAGLNERAVSFTKGCYVGQETVARLYYRGKPNRHLRGLRLAEPAAPGSQPHPDEPPALGNQPHPDEPPASGNQRHAGEPAAAGDELRLGERSVGRLGSVVRSPTYGPIALALVRREAAPGDTVAVGEQGTTAVIAELPFR